MFNIRTDTRRNEKSSRCPGGERQRGANKHGKKKHSLELFFLGMFGLFCGGAEAIEKILISKPQISGGNVEVASLGWCEEAKLSPVGVISSSLFNSTSLCQHNK
jgi:hypothetical protein